ncbi:MAG: hypothetical protein Q8S84_07540 [bacterium]|nr:hypothetical protein [bacterium]MDP3381300.1 hypothetical protein [bacterium]
MSDFAIIISPEVSLSSLWTIQGLCTHHILGNLSLQCSSIPFTRVFLFPSSHGTGCTFIHASLFKTINSLSSYTISKFIFSGFISVNFSIIISIVTSSLCFILIFFEIFSQFIDTCHLSIIF